MVLMVPLRACFRFLITVAQQDVYLYILLRNGNQSVEQPDPLKKETEIF